MAFTGVGQSSIRRSRGDERKRVEIQVIKDQSRARESTWVEQREEARYSKKSEFLFSGYVVMVL